VHDPYGRCGICFPCSCDDACKMEGTCCPQVNSGWAPPPTERAQCLDTQSSGPVLTVTSCDPQFPNGETRRLCETRPRLRRRDALLPVTSNSSQVTYANVHCAACNHDDWATVTWDMVTNCKHNQFMYNVTTDRQYEDRALQLKDVCDVTSQPHDDLKYSLHVCRHIFYGDNVISTCNVTGFWEAEDAEVLALCDQESSNGARVYVFTYGLYRNVFCAMCNVRADFLHSNYEFCMFHNGGAFGPPPDFRGTFDLVNTRRSRRPAFFDFAVVDGVCSQLQCADGKTLTGGECKTAVSKVRGLGYHIKLLLQVTQIRRSSRTILLPSGFTPVPRVHLANLKTTTIAGATTRPNGEGVHVTPGGFPISSGTRTPAADPFSTTSTPSLHAYDGPTPLPGTERTLTAATYPFPPDMAPAGSSATQPSPSGPCASYADVLKDKLMKLTGQFVFDASVNITSVHSQTGVCFMDSLKVRIEDLAQRRRPAADGGSWVMMGDDLHEATFLNAIVEADLIGSVWNTRDEVESELGRLFSVWELDIGDWILKLSPADLTSGFQSDGAEIAESETGGAKMKMKHTPYETSPDSPPPAGLEDSFLPAGKRLVCPYAEFQRHEFQIQENKHTTRVLFPYYVDQDKLPVEFDARTENGAWLSEDGQLMICADSLLTIFPANVTFAPPAGRPSTYVLQVVSVVCGSVSIVCLAATFITYCLFSELRSLPGLHNMGLSVTLASAQLTLLVPWHRTRSSAMCRAVGVITHWAWLSALCWMGVCCTHMVRVFTASSRRTLSRPETLRAFLRGLLLALLVPTVVVAITLGTSAAASGGEHVGYGGGVCFLETGLHVGLAFLLPLALLVVLNLTCFIFTVISIMRVRRLQAQTKRDRSDVLVYAKLATVTGGAWTLGLLAEATDQDWLRVVAELCTASQGLLLFLSYVCNSRVLNLYRNRLGCRVRDPQSTTLTTSSPTFKLTSTDVSDNNARSAGEAGSNP
ncbi:hypothetical protein BaRGS_00010381, partial [Batillaria attramentaria]